MAMMAKTMGRKPALVQPSFGPNGQPISHTAARIR
jgi:hypothetical protein